MLRFIAFAIIALCIVAAVGGAFYLGVGVGAKPSEAAKDWADFGSFFGGVAGALLSFFTVLLLIYGSHQQLGQIQDAQDETRKRDLLQYVTRAEDHVDHWLSRKLPTANGGHIELGDIVWGLSLPDVVSRSLFDRSLERLLRLMCSYSAALGLYRANVDHYFVYQLHREKALALLEYLHAHQDSLSLMAGPSIQFCRMHIEGKSAA
ncbi:MAG: hypothetical protein AB7O64_12575 [Methylibium sp.]